MRRSLRFAGAAGVATIAALAVAGCGSNSETVVSRPAAPDPVPIAAAPSPDKSNGADDRKAEHGSRRGDRPSGASRHGVTHDDGAKADEHGADPSAAGSATDGGAGKPAPGMSAAQSAAAAEASGSGSGSGYDGQSAADGQSDR